MLYPSCYQRHISQVCKLLAGTLSSPFLAELSNRYLTLQPLHGVRTEQHPSHQIIQKMYTCGPILLVLLGCTILKRYIMIILPKYSRVKMHNNVSAHTERHWVHSWAVIPDVPAGDD